VKRAVASPHKRPPQDRTEPPARPKRDGNRWPAPSLSRESPPVPPAARPRLANHPGPSTPEPHTSGRARLSPGLQERVHKSGTRPTFLHLRKSTSSLGVEVAPWNPLTHTRPRPHIHRPRIPPLQPCSTARHGTSEYDAVRTRVLADPRQPHDAPLPRGGVCCMLLGRRP
jgi:hypothetical protein